MKQKPRAPTDINIRRFDHEKKRKRELTAFFADDEIPRNLERRAETVFCLVLDPIHSGFRELSERNEALAFVIVLDSSLFYHFANWPVARHGLPFEVGFPSC